MTTTARCYDATTPSAGDPFKGRAERAHVVYHAYPWIVDSGTSPASNWIEQIKAIPEGSLVCLDYEPQLQSGGPLDPRVASINEIRKTHTVYAEALLKVLPVARERKLRVGVYSWVDLFPANDVLIVRDPASYREWQKNVKAVADLKAVEVHGGLVRGGLSVMDIVRGMNGHNWVPFYWQPSWGVDQPEVYPWRAQNATQCIDRVCCELEKLGVPVMPLITGGQTAPYSVNFNRIQLRAVKSRGDFAVWGSDKWPVPESFVAEALK